MARILGLDLGSYSLKGALLDTAQRTGALQAVFEVPRPQEGDRWDTLRAALRTLRDEHPVGFDQVVVALPGPSLATHSLSLPFADAKRLEAALPFEVEGQLPFELSEVVFDYQVTAQQPGKSELLVGMVRTEELKGLLAVLAELDIDPRIVTHPAVAYQSLWLAHPETWAGAPGGAIAVVDIGHERTSVAVGTAAGGLEAARTFAGGGKELTRALAQDLQVTVAQAHHWKEHQGAVGPSVEGSDQERVAAALVRGLQPLLRELRATIKSHTARTRRAVERVYLCGGTARLPGLAAQLAQDLGIAAELLPVDAELESASQGQPLALAQAYALGLRGQLSGAKAPRFNLRRGEFAFKGHYDYLKVRAARLALYAAVLLVLFVVFGLVRNTMLGQREAAVDEQLCKTTQAVLGRCEKNYDRAISMLQGKESPAAAVPKVSAVNVLSELTQRVPSDVAVTFDQVLIEPDRLSLRGTTDSSKQIDRITQALKGYRCFHEIQVGKLEKTKGDHVNFQLDVQVDCPDQAQANAG